MNPISIFISIIAAVILIFSGKAKKPLAKKKIAIISAFIIHSFASLLILAQVRIGEGWSGYSAQHNMPIGYWLFGSVILYAIFYAVHSRVEP